MSTHYSSSKRVPTEVLATRLDQLSRAVADGPEVVRREFTMRVPVEIDRDADVVLPECARRLREFERRRFRHVRRIRVNPRAKS